MSRRTALESALRSAKTSLSVLAAVVAFSGCYSAELDPETDAAFRCADDADCPGDLTCDGLLCVNGESLPSVEILTPEDLQTIDGPRLVVNVGTNLTLVPPGSDVQGGEGYLVVTVDGEEIVISDALGPREFPLRQDGAEASKGPHRIAALAFRSDGTRYANATAGDRHVVWIPDGEIPFVAISKPWPGTEIPIDSTTIDVEVVSFGFKFGVPLSADEPPPGLVGHAHVHYDATNETREFADCINDVVCDDGYVAVVTPSSTSPERAVGTAQLPAEGGPRAVTLGAILRSNTHSPFLFDPDPTDDPDDPASPAPYTIRDEIPIQRAAPAP